MEQKTIAVIHRDKGLASTLAEMAQQLGYSSLVMIVDSASAPQQVSSFVDRVSPDLVLLAENYQRWIPVQGTKIEDFKLGEGIDALVEIRKNHPTLPVYMVSGNPKHMEEAMQRGANGYLPIRIGFKGYEEFLKSNL